MNDLLMQIRARLRFAFWFERFIQVLVIGAGAMLLHTLCHKLWYLTWSPALTLALALTAGALVVGMRAQRRVPTMAAAAARLDDRCLTKDRFQTAFSCPPALAATPHGSYLLGEVAELSRTLPWRQQFPLRLPHRWYLPVILLLATGAVAWCVPDPPAPLTMGAAAQAAAVTAVERIEETAAALAQAAQAGSDEKLAALAEELAASAQQLRDNIDEKDKTLAELDRLARDLAAYEQAARASAASAMADMADDLAKTGAQAAAEALRRGEWTQGMNQLAEQLAEQGLANAGTREAMANALTEAANRAGGTAGEQLRRAAQAARAGDAAGAAQALREAARQDPAHGSGQGEKVDELGSQLESARQRIINDNGSGNAGSRRSSDRAQNRDDNDPRLMDCTAGPNGGRNSGQNSCGQGQGQGQGQGSGRGPQHIEGAASGIGLGSTNQQQIGGAAPHTDGVTREAAPSRYGAYEQIYGSQLLAGEAGREVMASGTDQGGAVLEEVTSVVMPPGFGRADASLPAATARSYREAAGVALEREEIPESHRDYVRRYFSQVVAH